nr:ATP-binding protein [Sphingomicrobium sediminis]
MTEATAHVGHWRIDLESEELYWSDETCRIHGVPAGCKPEMSKAIEFFHPDDRHIVTDAVDHAARTGEGYRFTARLVREDGEIRTVESVAKVEQDEKGHAIGLFGVFWDRTEELQREDALRRALKAAKHATSAKSRFLANMSHEIRTPMNGVIGFTDLLLAEPLSERQRRYVQLISDSGRSMLQLLNDILDISKIEAGSLELAVEPVDIRAKLEDCADIMRAAAEAKGISITVEVADDVPQLIAGDRLRFRQILLNLLGNAVKFTDEGGVVMNAHVELGDGARELVIDVIDSGIGIGKAKREMVFQSFGQADATTARKFGGSGLGLSISRNLAELMDGSLEVESELGVGSTFTIRLPIKEVAVRKLEDMAEARRASSPGKGRVLIAEDNEVNQMLSKAMCERLGLESDIAENGREAVEKIELARETGHLHDLILMDLQMPEMDGLEATRNLRAIGYDAERLPIVALTANAFREDIDACLAAGMQDHLTKPVRLEDMQAMLAKWMPRHAGGDPVEEVRAAV